MSYTFEEIQALISTLILLPALVSLIVLGLKRRLIIDEREQWSPLDHPERDWWGEEEDP